MTPSLKTVALGDILERSTQSVALDSNTVYREVTVRMYGKGVVERRTVKGIEIASDRRFLAKAGQYIISRIDARHGASGLIPPELDGAIVTNDFPLFNIARDQVDPQFFEWMTKTASFVELCKRASEGTTNRVRLAENRFCALTIQLPPLDEQRRIASRIYELTNKIAQVESLKLQTRKEFAALWSSVLNSALRGQLTQAQPDEATAREILEGLTTQHRNFTETKANNAHPHKPKLISKGLFPLPPEWVWTTLGSVLTHLVDCVNDTPNFADHDTGFLGLKSTNIRPYRFELSQKWFVTENDFKLWNRREAPQGGDIVLTREAPVGYACRIPDGTIACLTQRLMLLRADPTAILPELLLHYLNSPVFLDQVLEHSRGLTTPHIRVQDAPNFLLPLPPLRQQKHISSMLATLKAKSDAIVQLRAGAEAEMDAMLPAILDKAFRGEL